MTDRDRPSPQPRTRLNWRALGLATGAVVLLVAAGATLGLQRGVAPKAPDSGAPFVAVAPEVLSAQHDACVRNLPRAPGFHTVRSFTDTSGDLRATWTLTPTKLPPPPERRVSHPFPDVAFAVRLDLSAGNTSHSEVFGAHFGGPYPSDLTFCRSVPRTGPCVYDPSPVPPGVIAELSVTDCVAFACSDGIRWMIVRMPSSALVLRTRTTQRPHADRQICEPGVWQAVLEITLSPAARVVEEVQIGDPPKPFDCAAFGDARCTG